MFDMGKHFAIAGISATLITQTIPANATEIVGADFKPAAGGFDIILLTPAPEKLKIVSVQNGRVFKAAIANAQLSEKYRSRYGREIHLGNPAKGIEVLKIYQLENQKIQVCTFGQVQGSFTLKQTFQRGDTFVLRLVYANTPTEPLDNTYCQPPNKA